MDDVESFLTDPLERRLLAAFRALPNQKARRSVVKVTGHWKKAETDRKKRGVS